MTPLDKTGLLSALFQRFWCLLLSLCLIFSYAVMGISADSSRPTPVDPDDYFGRAALAGLSNGSSLVYAYDQIAKGVENCQEDISIKSTFPRRSISVDELTTVVHAYVSDYPQHFWLAKQYGYSYSGSTAVYFHPTYLMSGDTLDTARTQFDAAVENIMANITIDMSELEREKYLHDYLAQNIVYVGSDNSHNAYGALIEGQAVCEGYAEAFQYLLYQAGILNVIATGTGYVASTNTSEPHAWNLVKIDGDYYYVDLTWNDQTVDTFYAYFNITTDLLLEDHTLDELAYDWPVCTATKAHYFTAYGGLIDTFSVDAVIDSFNRYGYKAKLFMSDSSLDFWSEFSNNYSEIVKQLNIIGTPHFTPYSLARERLAILTGQRRGDVNADQQLDSSDLTALANHINQSVPITDETLLKASDVNQDGLIDYRDHQRLYEHINEIRTIGPTGNTNPPVATKAARITLLPAVTEIAAGDGSADVSFDIAVTPASGETIGLLAFEPIAPTGTTIQQVNIAPEIKNTFATAEFSNNILLLTGSNVQADEGISQTTIIATVTLRIHDRTADKKYAMDIQNEICGGDSLTSYNLQLNSTGVLVTDEIEDISSTPIDSSVPESSTESSKPTESTVSSKPTESTASSKPAESAVSSRPIESTTSSKPVESVVSSDPTSRPNDLMMGDLDNNTKINAVDALMVLKAAVGITELSPAQMIIANLNGDNIIDAKDALIILKIAVGRN